MSVSVIKITEPVGVNKKTNKNANIYATSAAGAATGLALRQFVPVYESELKDVFFKEADTIVKNSENHAKKNVLSEVRNAAAKDKGNLALNLFLDRITQSYMRDKATATNDEALRTKAFNFAKNTKQKIKEAPQETRESIKELAKTYRNKIKASIVLTESNIKAAVKQRRPYAPFVISGLGLGALAGFVYNVVGAISRDA